MVTLNPGEFSDLTVDYLFCDASFSNTVHKMGVDIEQSTQERTTSVMASAMLRNDESFSVFLDEKSDLGNKSRSHR